MGIPTGDLNNVFSPYFTTKKQGFGLGLSLIHSIVHKHNGRITVDSEKGVGTSFTIQLPVDVDTRDD
jgi:signal transduction histidine kinase